MGLLSELLLFPVTGPIRGLRAIAEHVKAQVDAELFDEGVVMDKLLDLSMRHDLGEISDDEYEAQETALLEHLNEIRAYKEELMEAEADVEDDGS
jgi:hypothetical protein